MSNTMFIVGIALVFIWPLIALYICTHHEANWYIRRIVREEVRIALTEGVEATGSDARPTTGEAA